MATVLDATTFTIPVNVSDDGVGGTLKPVSAKSAAKRVNIGFDGYGQAPTVALRANRHDLGG